MNTDNTQPLTVLLDDARDFKDNRSTAKLRGEHVGSGRVASGHRPNSLSRLSTKDA